VFNGGSAFSYFYEMKSGVRQGGVLSPLLFAIHVFIDDLVKLIDTANIGCKTGGSCNFYMQMILSCWRHQLRLYSL